MAWTWDAPTGTYRNHSLSTDIRRIAIADVQFMKFLRPEPGYGKNRGESVTITRIMQLPAAGRVSEIDRLPSGRPAITTKQVSVSEWGFKIPVTDFETRLAHFNIMDPFQAALRDQMTLTMDGMAASALKQTPIKYVPKIAGATITTNGTPSGVSDKNLDVGDLRAIHDYLATTLLAPRYRNGLYVGILSTKAARGIKNDATYASWFQPTTSEPFVSGRLRDVEGFMLIESNNVAAMAALAGTSTTTGEAIFFGADAAGLVRVLDPELRTGIPEDLGRFREIGWVGILEAFLTWELAANARVVHVTSA